ncbi:MCP four helix bundle domain-containing protein [Persicitalea sp.]|uniref:MCP four helix bundle domain-containing protein n=1 Tax=Persicitalea sp. TaxID=3100273 RepID=UPI003593D932
MDISQLLTQKVKVAALLFLVMAFVVLYSLRVDNRAHHLDEAVTSVYKDRLQPALIIVYLSENLHDKRRLLDNHLSEHSRLSATELKTKLAEYDEKNDQLVANFEQTLLTRNEAAVLKEFKSDLATNSRLESVVMQRITDENREIATALYNKDGVALFRQSIENLHILARIQSETGQEIVLGSHRDAAGVSVITSLMIAVAVIVGILIQSLIQKIRFHLN